MLKLLIVKEDGPLLQLFQENCANTEFAERKRTAARYRTRKSRVSFR
jgi:hypothetical protein